MELFFIKEKYVEKAWGGNYLHKNFNKEDIQNLGESFEISKDSIIINNSKFNGFKLNDLFFNAEINKDIFGRIVGKYDKFPLLIKMLDANENLSVQLHPTTECGGKREMWYVLDCLEDSKIVSGLDIEDKEEILKLNSDNIESKFKYTDIRKGDVIFIPDCSIHALLKGTVVYEIQEYSDITYRLYDWYRKDRETHLDKVYECYQNKDLIVKKNNFDNDKVNTPNNLFDECVFDLKKFIISNNYELILPNDIFKVITVIDGEFEVSDNDNKYTVKKGTTFLVPAVNDKLFFNGNGKILLTVLK